MGTVEKKLRQFLHEPMDLDRPMPNQLDADGKEIKNAPVLMPYFNQLPFQTQRMLIESYNPGRGHKPLDVRKYPMLEHSGVKLDPHRQKVCPVCSMIVQRTALRRFFGGCCPKCGCRLEI